MRLDGSVALVTGAASGIGFATSIALAERGTRLIAVDIDGDGLERLEAELGSGDAELLSVTADVIDATALAALFEQADECFGGIDVLANVAGVNTGRPRFPNSPRERWERTLAVDLWAVMATTELAIERFRRRGGGLIVNVASLAGATPFPADPAYAAAKAGVVNLTQSLGFLAEEQIRVVCLCPGMVDTPLLSKRELAPAEEELVRSLPLLAPNDVARAIIEVITNDELHAVAVSLLPRREPRVIEPALQFDNDPSHALAS